MQCSAVGMQWDAVRVQLGTMGAVVGSHESAVGMQ